MGKRKKERSLSVRLSGIEIQSCKREKIEGDLTERDRDRERRERFADG